MSTPRILTFVSTSPPRRIRAGRRPASTTTTWAVIRHCDATPAGTRITSLLPKKRGHFASHGFSYPCRRGRGRVLATAYLCRCASSAQDNLRRTVPRRSERTQGALDFPRVDISALPRGSLVTSSRVSIVNYCELH